MPEMAVVETRSPVQYAKLPAGDGNIAAWSLREASTPEPVTACVSVQGDPKGCPIRVGRRYRGLRLGTVAAPVTRR